VACRETQSRRLYVFKRQKEESQRQDATRISKGSDRFHIPELECGCQGGRLEHGHATGPSDQVQVGAVFLVRETRLGASPEGAEEELGKESQTEAKRKERGDSRIGRRRGLVDKAVEEQGVQDGHDGVWHVRASVLRSVPVENRSQVFYQPDRRGESVRLKQAVVAVHRRIVLVNFSSNTGCWKDQEAPDNGARKEQGATHASDRKVVLSVFIAGNAVLEGGRCGGELRVNAKRQG